MRSLGLLVLLAGCGAGGQEFSTVNTTIPNSSGTVGGPGSGATPGGQKDIAQARAIIAGGQVPDEGYLTVEGLLSEHDLPIAGGPCTSLFCARPASGIAKSLETGKDELWLQLGMATNLDPDHLPRPPIDVVAVVDTSSSMSVDIAQVDLAVANVLDHLGPNDRFAVVTTDNDVSDLIAFGTVGNKTAVKNQILGVGANGGTNLLGALQRGYQMLEAAPIEGHNRRVLMFTCGYPDVTALESLAKSRSQQGIGLSLFGVLLGFSPEMAHSLSALRGGNFFFLEDLEKVEKVFAEDFDLIVTPLAYDLDLKLTLADGVHLVKLYGLPEEPGATSPEVKVSTVFASRAHGAIVARLSVDDPSLLAAFGRLSLSYEPALSGNASAEDLPLHNDGAYDGPGVRKAVALSQMGSQMIAACHAWYNSDQGGARKIMDELIVYFSDEAAALADPALDPEITLLKALRANMH